MKPHSQERSSRGEPPQKPSQSSAPESTVERRKKPREVGLANEARPGLGTRADNPDPAAPPKKTARSEKPREKPPTERHHHEEPTPEPREQAPDTLEHETERSTGVSGHMGNT